MKHRESHFGKLFRCFKLRIIEEFRVVRDMYYKEFSRCRRDMQNCIENDRCMLEFGCIGLRTTFGLIWDTLVVMTLVAIMVLVVIGVAMFGLWWLCFLIHVPQYTIPITAIIVLPFIIGCVCGCRLANKMEENNTDRTK